MGQSLRAILHRYIFADELSLDARRINIMLLFGFFLAVGCTIMRVIEMAPMSSLIIQAAFIIAVIVSALVVNIYQIYTFTIYAAIVFLDFILFPLALLFNGGFVSGMPAFFAMGIALIAMLTSGRRCGILIAINVVWAAACYALVYRYPQLVATPASPLLPIIDHIGSFLMVGLFIAAVIRVQDRLYLREHTKVIASAQNLVYRDRLRVAVNELSTVLLNTSVEEFDAVLKRNIGELAVYLNIDRALIWQNTEQDGKLCYQAVFQWTADPAIELSELVYPYTATPGWYPVLVRNKIISGSLANMDSTVRKALEPSGVRSLLLIPSFYQNRFEGFVSFDDCHRERDFSQDEIDIMRSAALILTNAMIRNQTNASLVEAREEAMTSSRAKSEFLSNMSHEIRTPMNAITGMITIAKNTDDVNRKNECLDKMEEASVHLLGIINDVLDMSKIEANKLELVPGDFLFSRLIDRIVTMNTFQLKQKNLVFQLEKAAEIPDALYGDEQRISQVITNIFANAIKFTPEGGTISLRTRLLDSSSPGRYLVGITVSDSGIGISAEQMGRLFKPFQQAESTTSRRFGGTGLGLVISKRIIELMGGSISVDSELGVGSSFEIAIPLEDAHDAIDCFGADMTTQQELPSDAIFTGRRILLAEDIEINREIVAALMEPTGIEIEPASNGIEAVRLFEQAPRRYDLILMDMQMPEMDGLEATRRIRALADPWAHEVPIIALTANVFKEDIAQCMSAGMNDHLGKPLDQARVVATLRTYLR
ncbi:MAG: response regulator [Coriobacteriales bacterium]|jgi:signal transduction histidine kinase/ActR/RegA family two-component response regulator|nr:response regulator [Coriobacteriales bacterium]